MHETDVRDPDQTLYATLADLDLMYLHVLEAELFAGYSTIAQAGSWAGR